ncbi:ferric reductase family protein CYBJADRAFT_167474 [Cyberlindnera jadinii NRRL Y-1542]|uniref:FAD-binding FR-type domain-containing protein n=1 Tax=Cyberlindnera jadinii (strain ATCC 18201 / CBS 1600 / BCRC 20928 / JCM 3617 / NBRC 0987 / NRRL Y-1542) TaxID=983966 RepID=A0A1E4RTN4_CYBJN|nr:hypothetical protein CYBJADRAFT_170090 [Cyberlindnera jadinii NRRL Y-1542]XP_020071131.1 hypothetical protein CYBJADRAFT_167474 [Cyberlindnera jadinii NRRL Y-1542]ODV70633.1 hypothetical protein CYBJADRAFT_170090 [Cyberlindnera jadinii NRRL Y-1542]ODV74092.1 hypothetical protein CYBJADRAFT_167474 [Cyberlindnera jadinii NRRL Y-1542]
MFDVIKRHGSHHFVNVKYGYIVLFAGAIYLACLFVSNKLFILNWNTIRTSKVMRRVLDSHHNVLTLFLWTGFLMILAFWHFDSDSINVYIKRFGRLCYALVPLDIFLSLKPSPIPDVYYLELIFLHKWFSRLIVTIATVHSIGFIAVWISKGTMLKFFKPLNFLGFIALLCFLAITVVSLKPLRRRFYKLFFTGHVVLAWACVALMQWHARPGVSLYTLLNISLIILQIATKFYKSSDVILEKKTNAGSTLDLITFNNNSVSNFVAGSHIRISYPRLNPLNYLLPSHPFTVASLPDDASIKLVVRKTTKDFKSGELVSCFGPFTSINNKFFETAETVVLIAGGSGISYALGLYQQLKNSNANAVVVLVWVLRNRADLWILDHFPLVTSVDVYITGGNITSDDPVSNAFGDEDEELLDQTGRDSFEMEDLDTTQTKNTKIKLGRPNLELYASMFSSKDKNSSWVVSCGTDSLNKDSAKWASTLDVRYHSESYSL